VSEPIHVVVLYGGWSNERPVSLVTGEQVAAALDRIGYRVTKIDMDRDVALRLAEAKPDVVFNALHGTPGEDGTIQGMLDLMGITYTHSGLTTSVIAIDKQLTKAALVPHGIRMPGGHVVRSESLFLGDPLARPYVLKPVNEGSSVGVAIVTNESNYGSPIGRDVAVLGDKPLCVTELKPKTGFYDFEAKYTDGLTDHVCPANVPDDVATAMMDMAIKAHRVLGCKGASRSDFRWDDEKGVEGVYLLEINTQPGMTPLSLVPEQAKQMGISYEELVDIIVKEALNG
jgi:D-alanine-D-alanine ligase